jgi:hypothetical protein
MAPEQESQVLTEEFYHLIRCGEALVDTLYVPQEAIEEEFPAAPEGAESLDADLSGRPAPGQTSKRDHWNIKTCKLSNHRQRALGVSYEQA